MTVVYQYTKEQHDEAQTAIVLQKAVEKMLKKGLLIRGVKIESIYHLIYLLDKP